ncbi:ArsR/SmtB family transcription factor [Neomicrococcus lactis]|uniref:ArsR family transcriptional regulator n=1 Tax=Neomicrococcus lactis TaxID=732241 RepID=A0A7W8YC94_9MICC|nr:metalloregulator ArsR/SmtB family transcription factor [Neomicrococcus lactis]MBB5598711.1 ArsR family transcriptional regulator [Neomicrococcus lactis]
MSLTDHSRPLYEVKAGLFKGLSHPLRIRILELLADGEEHTVAELQADTALEASHLSQHLAVIRRYQLVTSQRRANHVYYRLAYPQVANILQLARELLEQILDDSSEQREHVAQLPAVSQHGSQVS